MDKSIASDNNIGMRDDNNGKSTLWVQSTALLSHSVVLMKLSLCFLLAYKTKFPAIVDAASILLSYGNSKRVSM